MRQHDKVSNPEVSNWRPRIGDNQFNRNQSQQFDRNKNIQCFGCYGWGHYKGECPSIRREGHSLGPYPRNEHFQRPPTDSGKVEQTSINGNPNRNSDRHAYKSPGRQPFQPRTSVDYGRSNSLISTDIPSSCGEKLRQCDPEMKLEMVWKDINYRKTKEEKLEDNVGVCRVLL
ncbi:hypothetical protein SNE40_018375 [Patella caerulea]|uniref:CCHC-type domain-containing protein n=1 Tax=Patella caerulea TaxID=87958 RepID=A0AAN8P718_PATCE